MKEDEEEDKDKDEGEDEDCLPLRNHLGGLPNSFQPDSLLRLGNHCVILTNLNYVYAH